MCIYGKEMCVFVLSNLTPKGNYHFLMFVGQLCMYVYIIKESRLHFQNMVKFEGAKFMQGYDKGVPHIIYALWLLCFGDLYAAFNVLY